MMRPCLHIGISNVAVDDDKFFAEGGSELAAMSTSDQLHVAKQFSESEHPVIFRFDAFGTARDHSSPSAPSFALCKIKEPVR